jgi:hypothetical protein
MPNQLNLDTLVHYMAGKLREHGQTPAGVDWRDEAAQFTRFDQLLRVMKDPSASVIDFGCGYGALLEYMRSHGFTGRYHGIDICAEMVLAAERTYAADVNATFAIGAEPTISTDYAVASGLFNMRLEHDEASWQRYVADTIKLMDRYSRQGFAFNCLTSYSDSDRMRPDLYYGNPCYYFDLCKRLYSKQVALLHDYGLYDFTIIVRKI